MARKRQKAAVPEEGEKGNRWGGEKLTKKKRDSKGAPLIKKGGTAGASTGVRTVKKDRKGELLQ